MPVQLSGKELTRALAKDGWQTMRISAATT